MLALGEKKRLSTARSIPRHELFTIFLNLGKSYVELQKVALKCVHLIFTFYFSVIISRKDTEFMDSKLLKPVFVAIKKKKGRQNPGLDRAWKVKSNLLHSQIFWNCLEYRKILSEVHRKWHFSVHCKHLFTFTPVYR